MLQHFSYFKPGQCPREYLDNSTLLKDKVAIVTGANLGIGYQTTKGLYKMGAHVILACRDETKANNAIESIKKECSKDAISGSLDFMHIDLSDLASVTKFVDTFKEKNLPLHILVNNAGAQLPGALTKDGIEINFQTNHLAHYLLTRLLFDKIVESNGRVVNVSSFLHAQINELWIDDVRTPMKNRGPEYALYSHTKLCNVLFTKELQKKFGDRALAVTLNPGVVDTNFVRHSSWYVRLFMPITASLVGKTVEDGAQTSLFCCVEPDIKPGAYYVDCKETETSKPASNPDLAHELWVKSEELVKDYLK
jgi:NAD(P)-dependent dehydrogenase (short-subunit alcohol dehydrogenase family)